MELQIRRYLRRTALVTSLALTAEQQEWLEGWVPIAAPSPLERVLLEHVLWVMRGFDQGGEWFDGDRPPTLPGRRGSR